jgi:hypothetical protein
MMQTILDFRIADGLLERPVYREFFVAGLTVFDPVEGFNNASDACLDVQNLIREIGLIADNNADEAFHEIELEMAGANAEANDRITDKEDLLEETNQGAVTLVPGLPAGQ